MSCLVSVAVYIFIFGWVVDRPLSLGLLRLELAQKTLQLARLASPKLVILAGSNGPYSHSCAVFSAMLKMPCENAGIAVGIGLDEIFARYSPLLHRGDIVYMPMELPQYTATRAQYRSSVDGAYLFRWDRPLLLRLPSDRVIGAILCCTLEDLLEAVTEMPLARSNSFNPSALLAHEYDSQGDRIDNRMTWVNIQLLRHPPRPEPSQQAIINGYGADLIGNFVRAESAQGVRVIGGLPTDYINAALGPETIATIAAFYTTNGGVFGKLRNHSLYPVTDFFNGEDHLSQPCQYLHSIAIARLIGGLLNMRVSNPPTAIQALAATCPKK